MQKLTLDYFHETDVRLWFNICLRLGRDLLDRNDRTSHDRLDSMIYEMKVACKHK